MKLLSLLMLVFLIAAVFTTVSVRADDDESSGGGAGSEGAAGEEDRPEATGDAGNANTGSETATQSEDATSDEIRMIVPSHDVATSVYFPNYPGRNFTQGEEVTALVGLSNSGDKTFNVTYIGASLRSPYDFSYIIQNFTVRTVFTELAPNSEITIEYKFKPDLNLEPLEFHLEGFVYYNSTVPAPSDPATPVPEEDVFRSAFINGTVKLEERKSDVDARALFTYVLLFSAVGLIIYIFINVSGNSGSGSGRSKRHYSRSGGDSNGVANAAAAASWDTKIYTPSNKTRSVSRSRGSNKK